jgi:hypothetical protein
MFILPITIQTLRHSGVAQFTDMLGAGIIIDIYATTDFVLFLPYRNSTPSPAYYYFRFSLAGPTIARSAIPQQILASSFTRRIAQYRRSHV